VSVDQGHVYGDVRQLLGHSQPAKSCPDDHNVWFLTHSLFFLFSTKPWTESLDLSPDRSIQVLR
jgi:hypothetical protein